MPLRRRKQEDARLAFGDTSGPAYAELIEAELRDEAARKASIETRGLSVVTSTGVIVGIVVAFAPAVVPEGSTIPEEALAFAILGALFLAAGLVCGIVANAPVWYDVAQGSFLKDITRETRFWDARRAIGSRRAAEVRVKELLKARGGNTRKSWWLRVALLMEALGIVSLGAAALLSFVLGRQVA